MSMTIHSKDNTEEILTELNKAMQRGLWAIGAAAEGHAKNVITSEGRVDTGTMRNSVTHVEDDEATYIGTNVEYAPYNELGTVNMRGIHFLSRAASEHTDEYGDLMKDSLENA